MIFPPSLPVCPVRFSQNRGSCLKGVLIGCVLFFVLVAMVMFGTFLYVKNHRAEVFGSLMTSFVDQALSQSNLSQEEQKGIKRQVERVTRKLEAGEITEEHFTRFVDVFGQGDLFLLLYLESLEDTWKSNPTIETAERDRFVRVFQRTKRGLVEKRFDQDQLVFIQKALPWETDRRGYERPVEDPSIEQVRNLVGDLETLLERVDIPEDPYSIDYVGYVRDLVDEVLGEKSKPESDSIRSPLVQSASTEVRSASTPVE